MGLEMVASRILAPEFGNSVFVWGSLIGVVLLALSLGYYVGGLMSDKRPSSEPLVIVLGLSSGWIALTPFFARRALPALSGAFPGKTGPLVSAFALFFVPSLLLAIVSPWCMRLLIRSVEKAGHSSGLLYAVSNTGSIFGTFVTTFFLIPRIGAESILRIMALVLLGLSFMTAALASSRRKPITMAAVALAAGASLISGAFAFVPAVTGGVIYEKESLYNHIYVIERGGTRLLKFDNSIQGGIYVDRPYDSCFPYADFFHLGLCLKEDISDVLVIGLGAGLVPKRFARDYAGVKVEVAEIDEEVCSAARKYFGFPGDDQVPVHIKDGRMFLRDSRSKYDIIMVDAYYADSIPFHLATIEFYRLVKEHLRPGGLVGYNIIGALSGPQARLFQSMYKTLKAVFPHTYVFPVNYQEGTEEAYRNVVVFGVLPGEPGGPGHMRLSRSAVVARAEELAREKVTVPGFAKMAGTLYEKEMDLEGAVVLTDDYAPVDSLLHLY